MQYDIDALKRYLSMAEHRYGLPPGVLHQTAWNESRFKPEIISGQKRSEAGAIGLMQFMPATAEEYGIDPTDPVQAIDGAGRYWRKMLNKYSGNIRLAAAAYNAGPGRVDRVLAGKQEMPEETRKYMATYEDPWAPNDGTVPPFQPGVDPRTGRFATPDGLPPPQLRHGYDPNVQPPMAPPPPMPVQDPYMQTSLNPYMSPEQFQQLSQAVFQDYMNPPQEETLPPWVSAIGMIGQGLTAAVNPEMAQMQLLTQQAAIEAKRAERRDRRQAMIDMMQLAQTFGPQAFKDTRPKEVQLQEYYERLSPERRQLWLERESAGYRPNIQVTTSPTGVVYRWDANDPNAQPQFMPMGRSAPTTPEEVEERKQATAATADARKAWTKERYEWEDSIRRTESDQPVLEEINQLIRETGLGPQLAIQQLYNDDSRRLLALAKRISNDAALQKLILMGGSDTNMEYLKQVEAIGQASALNPEQFLSFLELHQRVVEDNRRILGERLEEGYQQGWGKRPKWLQEITEGEDAISEADAILAED